MLKIVLYHYQNARIRRSVFAGLSLPRESNAGVHVQERVSQDRHGCLKARHLATNPATAHKHVIVFCCYRSNSAWSPAFRPSAI